MSDLQASIDISFELGTFYNIDLFQRGYYQIRVGLKSFTSRTPLKVTCHPPKVAAGGTGLRQATIIQGVAVSQTFQVMYRNEDVPLNNIFSFTVQMLLDSNRLEDSIEKAGLKLIVELWFCEDEFENNEKFEVACTRVFDMNFSPTLGLHSHVPVIFDYFHLSAICTTMHACLIALHQPIYNPRNPASSWPLKGGQMSTLDSVLFNARVPVHALVNIKNSALRSANYMFRVICRTLLSSHESLQNTYKKFLRRISTRQGKEPEYRDCHAQLDALCHDLEKFKTEEEFLSNATSKIAHLCAYNVVLWQMFVDAFTCNTRIIKLLAKEHHQARVKRFSEAFFTQEWQKKDALLCYEPSVNGHNDLATVVRTSPYFSNLPLVSLLSVELDGDSTNLPIIFEDIFKDETEALVVELGRTVGSTWDLSSLEDSSPKLSRDNKRNQVIKSTIPALLTRPSASKVYSMTDDDQLKREQKEQKSNNDPQLVGFKKLTADVEVEPYEVGCLSPSKNRENSGFERRKSLLLPEGKRRRRKQRQPEEIGTVDNFSEPYDHSSLESSESNSSSSSNRSTLTLNDVSMSPKSDRSVKLTNGHESPSPALRVKNSLKNKRARPQSAAPLSAVALKTTPPTTPAVSVQNGLMMVNGALSIPISKSEPRISSTGQVLVQPVADHVINFLTCKEDLKAKLAYQGHLYSDFANLSSETPYFWPAPVSNKGMHLVICVHGLDGNSQDLRLVRQYLELALSCERFEFLMSETNTDTFMDIQMMADKLTNEILHHLELYSLDPEKISIIAHSLGNIIVRCALTSPKLEHLLPKLHTYLSLSGPHLGTLYCQSGLVNMGMWVMQKWKKSGSLMQLAMKDSLDPKDTFIYKLSKQPGLEHFKNVLLVSSMQDKYVPYHSTRIELCRQAQRDTSPYGLCYAEMVHNILEPLIDKPSLNLIRYDVFHTMPTSTNTMIGRAAHIAVLDSELFLEKFILVCGCKYFKS